MQDFDDELHVDLTPLIDVIFMLVIFFIMTMSFTLPVVDFSLPQASTAQVENKQAMLRISINLDGEIKVKDQLLSNKEELDKAISTAVEEANKDKKELTLELVIDAQAPTQYLIDVADLARIHTAGRLSVVSEKTQEGENKKQGQ